MNVILKESCIIYCNVIFNLVVNFFFVYKFRIIEEFIVGYVKGVVNIFYFIKIGYGVCLNFVEFGYELLFE